MYAETIRRLKKYLPRDCIIANRVIIDSNFDFIDHSVIFTSDEILRPEVIQSMIDKYNIPRVTKSKMLIEKDSLSNRYNYKNYKFFNINNLDMLY